MITREEAIRLAEEAGFTFLSQWGIPSCEPKHIQRLITLAKNEAYREAAAVCMENADRCNPESMLTMVLETNAAAILALIEETK